MATTIKTKAILIINDKPVKNTFKGIKKATRELRDELAKIPRGTEEFQKKAAKLKDAEKHFARVKAEIAATRGELGKTGNFLTRITTKMGGLAGMFTTYMGGSMVLNQLGLLKDNLLEISDAITNVEKTSGLTTIQVGKLWHEFSNLDTRTAKMELMKIAEIGGRLGIKGKENLREFSEAIDKTFVALGDSFEGGLEAVTTQLGKLKNLFSETSTMEYPEALNRIGSALNELAANGTASEQNITDFATRVGQLPDALKPSAAKVLGLGAAFEESGEDARIAASGYSRFMTAAASNIDAFAYTMNMGVAEAKKLLNTHPEEFFIRFSEGMVGLDATQTAKIFKDLKLNTLEIQKSVGAAGKNGERFREMMQLSATAMEDATSLTDEFNKKNNNSAAIWIKIGKGIKEFFTDGFIPDAFDWFTEKMGWITGVISDAGDGISRLRNRLSFLTKVLTVATSAFIYYNVVMKISYWITKKTIKQTYAYIAVEKIVLFFKKASTAATLLYAIAKAKLFRNTKRATFAMAKFNLVTRMNPIGFIITLFTTAFTVLNLFSDSVDDSTKALSEQERQASATAEANKVMAEESSKSVSKYKSAVDPLISILKDQNTTLDMRRKAYSRLIELHPEYAGTVDEEFRATAKLDTVYKNLASSIRETAIARGLNEVLSKEAEEYAKAQAESFEAKLKKDKEDEKYAENRKYNKEIDKQSPLRTKDVPIQYQDGQFAGGLFSRAINHEANSTDAAEAYAKALKKERKAEERLASITSLFDKKKDNYVSTINKLKDQVKKKEEEVSQAKGKEDKKRLQGELDQLQIKKMAAEKSLYALTGISAGGRAVVETNRTINTPTNRELTSVVRKGMEERAKAERDAIKKAFQEREDALALLKDGEEKEIKKIHLNADKKRYDIQEETKKIEAEIAAQNIKIAEWKAKLGSDKTSSSDKRKLKEEVENLEASNRFKRSIIEINNRREVLLEESKQLQLDAVCEKYQAKAFEDFKKSEDKKLQQFKFSNEKMLAEITTMEEAKKHLTDAELEGVEILEQAKQKIRENANKKAMEMQAMSLKSQIALLEQLLPAFVGEAAEKMQGQLSKLYEAYNKLKLSLGGSESSDDDLEKKALSEVDVLGFSALQWRDTFSNMDTMSEKMAAVGMGFQALGNAAQMYAQYQKNINDKELVRFQKNQDRKKKALEAQLNSGLISQDQYHSQMLLMEARAEKKKRELALKQAKAEKAARIFSIIGSTATGIARAMELKWPMSMVVGALHSAIGATQLAIVNSQALPSYHVGGFTGGMGFQDATGHEVAGAVHAGEYVIPAWLLEKPEVANVAGWLETKRQGNSTSYDNGGYTSSSNFEQADVQSRYRDQDSTLTVALIQVIDRLTDILEEMEDNGIDAYVISDAKNGRMMEKAIKEFKTIKNKNRQ